MTKDKESELTHCRCGQPFESIYSQFTRECRSCERIAEATGFPAHFGKPNPPIGPAILQASGGL